MCGVKIIVHSNWQSHRFVRIYSTCMPLNDMSMMMT